MVQIRHLKVGLTTEEYGELVVKARIARKPVSTYVRDTVLNEPILYDKICESNMASKEVLDLLKYIFRR